MKKTLLLALGLAFTAAYAQQKPVSLEKVQVNPATMMSNRKAPQPQLADKANVHKAPRKAEADVLLYAKPEGSLYVNWNKEGRGYGLSALSLAPWTLYTFKNLSTNPESTIWKFMNPTTGLMNDVTQYRDEDFSYSSELKPGYYTLIPFLYNANESQHFAIGETTNYYWTDEGDDYTTMVIIDSVATVGFLDDHQSAYGWGGMDNGYLYGSGNVTDENHGVGYCYQLVQNYPKPMSPLYIEDVFFNIKSQTKKPLADGVELTLYFVDAETNAPFAALTATNDDIVDLGAEWAGSSSYARLTGEFQTYRITFAQKEVDDFGYEYQVPVVVNDAFYVVLSGLDQEGVEFGMNSQVINPEDADMTTASFLVFYPDEDEESQRQSYYYGDCALPLSFTAMFDKVIVATSLTDSEDNTYDNTNILQVSNDATQQGVAAGDDGYFSGVYVYTAQPWYGSEGEEFYFYEEDLPSWITALNVDNSNFADYGFNIVNVTAQPLPADVEGRYALIHIMGRGFTSEDPIIVVQGEVDLGPLGINNVTAEKAANHKGIYNLAGQKLTGNAKGLVISNGRKVIIQ